MALKKTGRRSAADATDTPLYQLVARTLQTEIVRGVYHVGSCLPSETDLMLRFGVSRYTVRTAIRMLQDAGLVKTEHGLGSLVQGPVKGEVFVHEISAISDLFPADAERWYDPIDTALVKLPRRTNFFPGLDAARSWLRITGTRTKPGADMPFNELEVFVAARFAGVSRLIAEGSGSIYTALEVVYGETIVEIEQVIGGFRADGTRGSKIGLKKGDLGIEVRRLHRISAGNEVAILTLNRFVITDYTFSMILKRTRR